MTEQWRPVTGWEGCYEVSDHGRVRSLERIVPHPRLRQMRLKPRQLKPGTTPYGHQTVVLTRSGKMRSHAVHRLVLEAFVGPCPPGTEVCHNNGDPADNRLENLYWGTRSDNLQDQVRHGVHINSSKTSCVNGHEFTPENTYQRKRPGGGRACKACLNKRKRDRRRQLKEKAS